MLVCTHDYPIKDLFSLDKRLGYVYLYLSGFQLAYIKLATTHNHSSRGTNDPIYLKATMATVVVCLLFSYHFNNTISHHYIMYYFINRLIIMIVDDG